MKLSVVMPVYNERATLREVVQKVLSVPLEIELICVDDGSRDGSREILAELQSEHPQIRVVLQPHNMGKGAALRRGIQEATGDFVIIQDADLEYDPAEYPLMIEPLIQGKADVVFGSRFLGGAPHRVLYFWHSVGNRALTLLSNCLTNINLSDMETCYKVFRREVIQSIPIEENRFGFEPEITVKVARRHLRIYEVGISYWGRTYEEGKKIGWKDGVRALYCLLKYSFKEPQHKSSGAGRSRRGSLHRSAISLGLWPLDHHLLVRVFLPQPPFVGVRTLVGRSCTLGAARSIEIDWRIGLILHRLQRGRLCRRFRCGRSRRRGGLGGLMLEGLQILGVGSGRRCHLRRLGNGHARFWRLFGGRLLDLEGAALLRQTDHAHAHDYNRNRQ